MEWAGQSVADKLASLRPQLAEAGAGALLVTMLGAHTPCSLPLFSPLHASLLSLCWLRVLVAVWYPGRLCACTPLLGFAAGSVP